MTDDLATTPDLWEMASTETLPLPFDAAPLLLVGEDVTLPTCILTDLTAKADYPQGLKDDPTVSGTIITQVVYNLVAGRKYRLAVSFTADVDKIWTMELIIKCIF